MLCDSMDAMQKHDRYHAVARLQEMSQNLIAWFEYQLMLFKAGNYLFQKPKQDIGG